MSNVKPEYGKYIREYDENNNKIHFKGSLGFEYWREFDKNNNLIHTKNSCGSEVWYKYDGNNKIIHYKDSDGREYWCKYDKNNKPIEITHQEFKQIERIKLYLNNKRINRFEIMDI